MYAFVTTAPVGLGMAGILTFPLAKPRYICPALRGQSYGQSPAQIAAVKLLWPVWAWNQKPHCSTALQG